MSKKERIGRSTLTPKLQKQITDLISLGMSPPKAAEFYGVHRNTMRYWMRRGEKEWGDEASIYAQFLADCRQAIARCMQRGLALIGQASAEDWRPAAWLLERRFPKDFAPKATIVVETQRAVEEIFEALRERLPPDVYGQVLQAMSEELSARQMPPMALTAEAGPRD